MPHPLLRPLEAVLTGAGALELHPGGAGAVRLEPPLPTSALVVLSSGSTGVPKRVALSPESLLASVTGTATVLGGHGQWLLALPSHYIAGALVLARSIVAGMTPVLLPEGPFTAGAFIDAAQTLRNHRRYTALVPTQLARLVSEPASYPALRSFEAILVGGASAGVQLVDRCRELGLPLVLTYGSAESCGGCVYDGRPLPGVQVRVGEPKGVPESGPPAQTETAVGPISLGGATIAHGYVDASEQAQRASFSRSPAGVRWYHTPDIGQWAPQGQLEVLGRADDVVITGGLKVSATVVADALEHLESVQEAYVIGVPDEQWGHCLVAGLTLRAGSPLEGLDSAEQRRILRSQARRVLARHEVPKTLLVLEQLPLLPNGKVDRRAMIGLLQHCPP